MKDINLALSLVGFFILLGFIFSLFKKKGKNDLLKGGFDPERFKKSLPEDDTQNTLMSLHLEDYGNFTKLRKYIDDYEVYDSDQGKYLPLFAFPEHIQIEIKTKLNVDAQESDGGKSNFVITKDTIASEKTNIRLSAPIDISTAPEDKSAEKSSKNNKEEEVKTKNENVS